MQVYEFGKGKVIVGDLTADEGLVVSIQHSEEDMPVGEKYEGGVTRNATFLLFPTRESFDHMMNRMKTHADNYEGWK